MSDIGVLPPGALVWLGSLGWGFLCLLGLIIFLLIALFRSRQSSTSFLRNRFTGYAIGAFTSGIVAVLSMALIDWSGSLGAFAHWIDRPLIGWSWLAMTIVAAPATGFAWNRSRAAMR